MWHAECAGCLAIIQHSNKKWILTNVLDEGKKYTINFKMKYFRGQFFILLLISWQKPSGQNYYVFDL